MKPVTAMVVVTLVMGLANYYLTFAKGEALTTGTVTPEQHFTQPPPTIYRCQPR